MTRTRPTIAEVAASVLTERGPLLPDALGSAVAELGGTRARDPRRAVARALSGDARFQRLDDGRWAFIGAVLDGAAFTHRLSAEEARTERIAIHPDLTPLAPLLHKGLRLATGGVLRRGGARRGRRTLRRWERLPAGWDQVGGPPGWLAGAVAGELIALRLVGKEVRVERRTAPAVDSHVAAERLVEAARIRIESTRAGFQNAVPAHIGRVVVEALVYSPRLLRQPVPPLGEVLTRGGLEVHEDLVGYPGTDWSEWEDPWETLWSDLEDGDQDALQRGAELGLDEEGVEALELVLRALALFEREAVEPDGELAADLARVLSHPGVAEVVAANVLREPKLQRYLEPIARAATGRMAAAPLFLLACGAEASGEPAAAERLLRQALQADPAFRPALLEAARYASDRGDAARALDLVVRAGIHVDDPQRWVLERIVRAAPVGREALCPCSSGRTRRSCCLRKGGLALPARASWLYSKASAWLSRYPQRAALERYEPSAAAAGWAPDELVYDLALFDDGYLERFLEARASLLPADEVELARSWLGSRRRLYEVVERHAAGGLTLRDLESGETVRVRENARFRDVAPLDLVYGRVVPDGRSRMLLWGPLTVPRTLRLALLALLAGEPDGQALVSWFRAAGHPARLTNSEGEPLVLCTATYRLRDPSAAPAALAGVLDEVGEGVYAEHVMIEGHRYRRGTITLSEDRAVIETDSLARLERLHNLLRRTVRGTRLLDRTEVPGDRLVGKAFRRGMLTLASRPELPSPAAGSGEAPASEAEWVDAPHAALDGKTPRQAAADPSLRPRLEALIGDVAWARRRAGEDDRVLDPDRLRELLGL